jgi:radical SAM protein
MPAPAVASTPSRPRALGRQECTHARAPRNVYWETTIACGLACEHCRAEAQPTRSPHELAGAEARALIDSVRELGSMLILTGGDPLERPDLFELIDYARSLHVPVAVTPSTTARLTREVVLRFADHGVAALGMSIDGATAATHDAFRGFPGTFDRARQALGWAAEAGLPVQVNTTVSATNLGELEALYELLARDHAPPVKRWSLFLIVPTGRAGLGAVPDAAALEPLYGWLYEMSKSAPFHIGTVEGPQYRRYLVQRELSAGRSFPEVLRLSARLGLGVRDGNGVIFVSHTGDVLPSGFVPHTRLGNVRDVPLHLLYREAPALLELRDMDRLEGKCGACEFRWVCGGSRARAAAMTGSALGADPLCAYLPSGWVEPAEGRPGPRHLPQL